MIRKIIAGFLIQEFDDKGKFLSQSFVEGDGVEYEDEYGELIDELDFPNLDETPEIR